MAEGRIIAERRGGILYLTISNPDSFNSVTTAMREDLIRNVREAENDDSVRVIVLKGDGEKCFCSGLSMEMLDSISCMEDRHEQWVVGKRIREALQESTKILVAAVKGSCAGNALEISLCCDLVFCAENSKFVLPELNIGLTPGCGGAIELQKHIPYHRFMEMVLLCDRMSPAEALHYGFVNKVFPLETMDEELDKILDKLAATAPLAVKGLKEQLYLQENVGIEAAYRKEYDLCIGLMGSKDFQNAVKSFMKKEKPVFKGE